MFHAYQTIYSSVIMPNKSKSLTPILTEFVAEYYDNRIPAKLSM